MTTVNFKIENFLGINESPDGDSGLRPGEAAEMYNFRITEEGNLKKLSGFSEIIDSDNEGWDVDGMTWWDNLLVFAIKGKVYAYDPVEGETTEIEIDEEASLSMVPCSMFIFREKLYILNGHEYLYWEGGEETIKAVEGYIPTVLIGSTPATGAGIEYEAVNQISSKRIQKFNGDNSAVAYKMGEPEIDSIDKVIVNGQDRVLTSDYTVVTGSDGYKTVTFEVAPTSGFDNVEIQYTKSTVINTDRFTSLAHTVTYHLSNKDIDSIASVTIDGSATTAYTADLANGTITLDSVATIGKPIVVTWSKVLNPKLKDMKYVQFFGGENNTRVFAYGDGTNTIYYSELTDGSTKPSAEYWPELNRMDIDKDDIPVTSLVPYYDRLFIFKRDSTYYARYSTFTGDDGDVIVSFPTTNVTKSVGCCSYEGAKEIPSGIIFPAEDGVYLAAGGAFYEQMSESLISKKVDHSYKTEIDGYKLAARPMPYTFVNTVLGEYWLVFGTTVLVYNYRNESWYKFYLTGDENGWSAYPIATKDGNIYFATGAKIYAFDGSLSYNGESINAYWESGSMDFGYFNQKKWIDRIWLTLKSEANSSVTLDLETDVTSDYPERDIAHGRATFASVNFANFSFNTNDKPASKMMRIKAKKFAFLKVILKNDSSTDACTVMNMKAPVTVGGITK